MVMVIHGGPWARDAYGYNASHQWLANRGYAVLSPNFRSSTGFGKSFLNAGNLEWGRKMQNDIDDAMDWAVAQRIAPRDKVAIMGGSYGGYATLAGLTFTPDRFACGVNIVGVSNLKTLLETIPPYWEAGRAQFHARMGNPNTPEGAALLRERSPLHFADRIRKPLLIGHGANDPRVKQAESDQIVKVMAEKKIPVTYVVFPDEGHGFARPQNNIAFNAVAPTPGAWSRRRWRSATATSTPPGSTRTRRRSVRPLRPAACRATRSSSRRRSGPTSSATATFNARSARASSGSAARWTCSFCTGPSPTRPWRRRWPR
jgi:dienelactone hydrolase